MCNIFLDEETPEGEIFADYVNGNRKDAREKYLLLDEWKKVRVIAAMTTEEQEDFSRLLRG